MINLIYVSHNPITRLQLDLLCSSFTIRDLIHIETRDIETYNNKNLSTEHCIRLRFPCGTYYSDAEMKDCIDVLGRIIDGRKRYTLVIPHLYNHLFAILAELRCVTDIYYLEEGNLSLGLVKKVSMRQCTFKELVKNGTSKLVKDIRVLTEDMFDKGANERITMMPYLENRPFPLHPKYVGNISISKKAFSGYSNTLRLNNPEYSKDVKAHIAEYTIIYLPNKHCKIPNWIKFEDKEIMEMIVSKTKRLAEEYSLKNIVLKPHTSTPRYYTEMMRNKMIKCIDWGEFVGKIQDSVPSVDIIEPAALPFSHAIFQCFSSALSYTRELSPNTRILYPYTFI